jgi:hypothetical protein
MLTPELQSQFVAQASDMFLPVAGGWGRMGAAYPLGESESRHADGRVAPRGSYAWIRTSRRELGQAQRFCV